MGALKGIVRGATVVLDHSEPELEGKRVVVLPEVVEDPPLTEAAQAAAWKQWAESSRQGPIEDDGEPSFP